MRDEKKYDIYERSFKFAVRVAKLLRSCPKDYIALEYNRQLIRSSGSIGANIEEADGTLTKKDFVNKMGISRREARESRHWLRLIQATMSIKTEKVRGEFDSLINEAKEIMLILSAIINKIRL